MLIRRRRTLGERIRGFRESAGLTQEALARSADIGRVTLVRLENGEQTPRFTTLEAMLRSIPAPAGEPGDYLAKWRSKPVYPRACGGTVATHGPSCALSCSGSTGRGSPRL